MQFTTFSLRTLLRFVTATGICIFAYLQCQIEKFESKIWNCEFYSSEIRSAVVSFDDNTSSHQLSRRDAIRFASMAEECPLREYDECPTSYLPYPGPLFTYVELTLSKKRTFGVVLFGDCLQGRECLVDISSKRDEITSVLWRPK